MVESFKMKTRIDLIKKRLDTPTDTASLVLLRIVVGLLMFWEMIRYYYNGWIRELYVKPQFHFQYEWFQWLKPLPEAAIIIITDHFPEHQQSKYNSQQDKTGCIRRSIQALFN